jgi:hypothetical protein
MLQLKRFRMPAITKQPAIMADIAIGFRKSFAVE